MINHEVKVCGNTSPSDLMVAVQARADSVGIIAEPPGVEASGHTVTFEQGQELARIARIFKMNSVLLPRTADMLEVHEMVKAVRPDRVQLSASDDPAVPAFLRGIMPSDCPEIAQVIHVGSDTRQEEVDPYVSYVDMIHLDTAGESGGGNGVTHDWHVSRQLARRARQRGMFVMLAGGLNAQNVLEAIEIVDPDGVDVQTSIKNHDGENDAARIKELRYNARFALRLMWRHPEYRRGAEEREAEKAQLDRERVH